MARTMPLSRPRNRTSGSAPSAYRNTPPRRRSRLGQIMYHEGTSLGGRDARAGTGTGDSGWTWMTKYKMESVTDADAARASLIHVLQSACSGELAAIHAYRGHWRSLR